MSAIEKSIEINVPVCTAYNQWTQFEKFPQFMEGVKTGNNSKIQSVVFVTGKVTVLPIR